MKTLAVRALRADKIEQLIDFLLREDQQRNAVKNSEFMFNMGTWFNEFVDTEQLIPACHTSACMAGSMLLLELGHDEIKKFRFGPGGDDEEFARLAALTMGIEVTGEDDEYCELPVFLEHCWPAAYRGDESENLRAVALLRDMLAGAVKLSDAEWDSALDLPWTNLGWWVQYAKDPQDEQLPG